MRRPPFGKQPESDLPSLNLRDHRAFPAATVAEFRRRVEERAVAELRRADGSYDLDFIRLDLPVRPS